MRGQKETNIDNRHRIVNISNEEIIAICELMDDAKAMIGNAESEYGFESWDVLTAKRIKKVHRFLVRNKIDNLTI